jgi:hypothetical protein
MAQYDVHDLDGGLVVIVQHDLVDLPETAVVVPLLPDGQGVQPVRGLMPRLAVAGAEWLFAPMLMATVPRPALGALRGSVSKNRDEITRALDILFQGI